MLRGRFAPSPTGSLHLGNLRTAMIAWLWARHEGGAFVVRIEDLDPVTSSAEIAAGQLRDLNRLGLDWDGEVLVQSERFDIYRRYLRELQERGLTYPCFCTRRDLAEAATAPHDAAATAYPGTCRHLGHRDAVRRVETGEPHAIRLRSVADRIGFTDLVAGRTEGRPDDVVLVRKDGVPAYHLAVVVDDALQGISQVVRGDDLLSATASQIHLAEQLGLTPPSYAHVPLVLSPSGQRLAKRDGSVTLEDRIRLGDNLVDVVSFLAASAGLEVDPRPTGSGDPSELLSGLRDQFDPTLLHRSPYRMSERDLSSPWTADDQ